MNRVCARDAVYAVALSPLVAYRGRRGPLRQADRETIRAAAECALVEAVSRADAQAKVELEGLIGYADRRLTADDVWDLAEEAVHVRSGGLSESQIQQASVLASAVLSELAPTLEDHLPAHLMPEVRQTIGNAIATVLHALDNMQTHDVALELVRSHLRSSVDDWTQLELLSPYRELWDA